jgi:hypothetical protein
MVCVVSHIVDNIYGVVFALVYEQPALLLLFGGFGGAQLIEYFINLKV